MDEQWEDTAVAWNRGRLGDRSDVVGPPDLSVNVLREICRQLSTPGLYGYRPPVTHPEPAAAWLIEPGGELDRAGVFTKLQQCQYYALGLGDMFVRVDAVDGQLRPRLVKPHNVEIVWSPDQPDQADVVRELRMRWDTLRETWIYCWDEYDLRKLKFRVLSNDRSDDVTASYELGLVDAWPWVYADGNPFLPWVKYHWRDTGEYWHHHDMRGVTRGTLQACLFATLTGHAAESASGKAVIASGLTPLGGKVQQAADGQEGVTTATVDILPGTILYHSTNKGEQPLIQEVGPGSDLGVLSTWLWEYVGRQASVFGINGSDVLRTTANPTSGASLSIQQRGQREFSNQVEPLFRLRDLEMLGKAAAMIRISGGPVLPEKGYAITYRQIPLSADERREQREHLDWQQKNGQLSAADVYMALNPGVTVENARVAIIRSKVDDARMEAEVARQLAEILGTSSADGPVGDPGTFGAQSGQAYIITQAVAAGKIPRDAGIGNLMVFYRKTEEQAKQILGSAGLSSFTPTVALDDQPPAPL